MFAYPEQLSSQELPQSPEKLLPELTAQYETELKAYNETGVLEILPEKEALGIVDIDGKEYPIPTLEAIKGEIARSPELAKKIEQGFTEMYMVPAAMPLDILKDRLGRELVKHAKDGKLFATKEHPTDPDHPLELNLDDPVYLWDQLPAGEQSGNLVYYPERFKQNNPGGLTKQQLIDQTKTTAFPGWIVELREPTVFLPKDAAEAKARTKGGRVPFENNRTPHDYLKTLLAQGESGIIPEGFISSFITRLHTTNQVSHDWSQNNGLWLLGAYEKSSDGVPNGDFYRDNRRVNVVRYDPSDQDSYHGALSAVRVGRR